MLNLDNQAFGNMEDYTMHVFKVAAGTYPYIKAPLAEKFNTVCPYSLNNRQCKLDGKGTCSLRSAYVCCPQIDVTFKTNFFPVTHRWRMAEFGPIGGDLEDLWHLSSTWQLF